VWNINPNYGGQGDYYYADILVNKTTEEIYVGQGY
jgi:hypothetical protein